MRATLRAGDSIYRVGGEEILVVLPGATRESAVDVAERLRLAVRDLQPVGVRVTVSIGVAVSRPGAVDTDDLVSPRRRGPLRGEGAGRDTVFAAASTGSAAEVDAVGERAPAKAATSSTVASRSPRSTSSTGECM